MAGAVGGAVWAGAAARAGACGVLAWLAAASWCAGGQAGEGSEVASGPADQGVAMTRPVVGPRLIQVRHPAAGARPRARLLYLPGISAYRSIDRGLLAGLPETTADCIEVYDWSAYNAGLGALLNVTRNRHEAQVVADLLTRWYREDPAAPTYVVAHSGGCGVAVWALEALPPEVKVDQVVLLQPAVSPAYDLSAALGHLRAGGGGGVGGVGGRLVAFSSPMDPVLGTMTRVFGTIDRVNTESAGLNGFVPREGYGRAFVAMPYRGEWVRYGHTGDHIGVLEPEFGRAVVAPLLVPAAR